MSPQGSIRVTSKHTHTHTHTRLAADATAATLLSSPALNCKYINKKSAYREVFKSLSDAPQTALTALTAS